MHLLTLSRAARLAFLLIFLSACGGGDEVTVNPNDPVEPEPSGLIITNANGLQTSLDEGNFTINAPGQAVTNDTDITYEKLVLDESNQAKNIISDIHTLTPSTVQLSSPMTVTIKIPDDYVLGGQLTLARLSGDSWSSITLSLIHI